MDRDDYAHMTQKQRQQRFGELLGELDDAWKVAADHTDANVAEKASKLTELWRYLQQGDK
jgi:hypothetical protein